MLRINVMSTEDIPFAISLTDYEKWGYVKADFERIIVIEPEGCFIACHQEIKVGMIATITHGDYAFIGNLIVRDGYRGRGIGKALMNHVLSYVWNKGINCIELDATFQGAPLYRALGFRDKYLSLRLRRGAAEGGAKKSRRRQYSLNKILSLDAELTGLNRSHAISRFIHEFPESVYTKETDGLKGFALVYPRANNVCAIGPMVAESVDTVEMLLAEIISHNSGHPLGIGYPESKHNFTQILLQHGFQYRAPSLRMYLGQKLDYESSIYGIISPDKD